MFKLFAKKDYKMASKALLYAVGRAGDDADLRFRLRTLLAVLIARNFEDDEWKMLDVVTSEDFYQKGYIGVNGDSIWACSYIGFERCTSKWAKEQGYNCVICMRIVQGELTTSGSSNGFEGKTHTVQFYF